MIRDTARAGVGATPFRCGATCRLHRSVCGSARTRGEARHHLRMANPLVDAERILSAADFESIERKITMYGEVLPLMAEALRELYQRVERLEQTSPGGPPGGLARY